MAFDYTNLYPDTSGNGGYTKSWNYTTVDDSIATCSASGYFNKVSTRLGIGDNIIIARVDAFDTKNRTALVEYAELFVNSITAGVVTTTLFTTQLPASPTFTGTATFTGNLEIGAAVAPDSLLTVNANTGASVAPLAGTALHVIGADGANGAFTVDAYGGNATIQLRVAGGTQAAKTVSISGAVLGSINGLGWDTATYGTAGGIQFRSTEVWTATAHGGEFAIRTVLNGTTTIADALVVKNSGGVSIGSGTDPGIGGLALHPGSSITPVSNGDLVIQATSNTSLTFKYKGSDGTVRSASLTLA